MLIRHRTRPPDRQITQQRYQERIPTCLLEWFDRLNRCLLARSPSLVHPPPHHAGVPHIPSTRAGERYEFGGIGQVFLTSRAA